MLKKPTYEELNQRVKELEKESAKRNESSELWMRSVFRSLSEAVLIVSPERIILNINEAGERMFGYSADELINQSTEVVHVDHEHFKEFGKKIAAVFERCETVDFEYMLKRKNGKIFTTEHTVSQLQDVERKVVGIVNVVRDITKRKQIEKTLLQHTTMLENILEKAADGVCVCHNILEEPYIKFTHWNLRMAEITGYTIEEINRLGWYQTIYPDPAVQKMAIERMSQMREGDDIQGEEWIITTKSGEKRALSISTSVVKKEGEKIHILAIMQDITERKRNQDALKESEKKYKLLADNSADGIYKIGLLNEKITYASPSVERMLGYAADEALSLTVKDVVTAASYAIQQEKLIQSIEIKQKIPEIMELEAVHRDGNTVPVEIHASILYDEQENPIEILGSVRDITERKIAEEKLLQEKRKLEKALAEIKKLSGLLPICASCKRIRDDNGYWNQIESFIRDHSEAEFSHSLCPQCAKELYPQLGLDDDKIS